MILTSQEVPTYHKLSPICFAIRPHFDLIKNDGKEKEILKLKVLFLYY